MGEFSKMMNEFKADREQLLKVTKDRENLLEKLKESTNGSIELVQENDRLQEYSNKILELNKLLSEKNDVLEEQIENRKVQDIGLESFNRIRE